MQKIKESIIAIIVIAGVLGVYYAAPIAAQEHTECSGPGCGEQAPPGIDQEEYERYWAQQRVECHEFWEEAERRVRLPADQRQSLPPLSNARRKNCMDEFAVHHFPKLPPRPTSPSQTMPRPVAMPTATPPSGGSDSSDSIQPATPPRPSSSQDSGPLLSPLHGFVRFSKTPLNYEPDSCRSILLARIYKIASKPVPAQPHNAT